MKAKWAKRQENGKGKNDGNLPDELYDRVLQMRKGETPADVTDYIAARKKNFPSKNNIVRKLEEIKTKASRGQLLSDADVKRAKAGKTSFGITKDRDLLSILYSNNSREYMPDPWLRRGPRGGGLRRPPPARHLLRRLLEKEIRREHSIILQCLRYISATNYLEDTDKCDGYFKELESRVQGEEAKATQNKTHEDVKVETILEDKSDPAPNPEQATVSVV